jgi:hypothetical protein
VLALVVGVVDYHHLALASCLGLTALNLELLTCLLKALHRLMMPPLAVLFPRPQHPWLRLILVLRLLQVLRLFQRLTHPYHCRVLNYLPPCLLRQVCRAQLMRLLPLMVRLPLRPSLRLPHLTRYLPPRHQYQPLLFHLLPHHQCLTTHQCHYQLHRYHYRLRWQCLPLLRQLKRNSYRLR